MGRAGGRVTAAARVDLGLVLNFDLEGQFDRNSLFVERGGMPAELANRLDHSLIHGGVDGANHLDILSLALFVDIELEDDFGVIGRGYGESGGKREAGGVKETSGDDPGADARSLG
jgi:hypothetical protein